jgi:hypothetical protein
VAGLVKSGSRSQYRNTLFWPSILMVRDGGKALAGTVSDLVVPDMRQSRRTS